MIYTPNRAMRKYQAITLRKMVELESGMIWYDPGLGKTKTAIDLMNVFYHKHGVRGVLVSTILSGLGVWDEELPKDLNVPANYKILYEESNVKRQREIHRFRDTLDPDILNILVVNHDCVRNEEVFKELFCFGPQMLIIDEVDNFRESKTLRFKYMYKIRRHSVLYAYGLTGTPLVKNSLNFFGEFKIINPSVFGENYFQFRSKYAVMDYYFPNKVKQFINQQELADIVAKHSVRVKDTDVKYLPQLIEQDIPVHMSDKTLKYYKQMVKELLVELENGVEIESPMAATKVIKLHQICGGFLMNTTAQLIDDDIKNITECFPIADDKLKVLKDLVSQNKGHQMIVGCRFTYEVHLIAEALKQMGLKVGVIEGGVSGKKRDEIKQSFQSHQLDIVVYQIQSASAQTLTAGDIGILYSSTYIYRDYWQWVKRIHRSGSEKPVKIYRLVCRGTIDEEILKRVAQGENFTAQLVDINRLRTEVI